MNVETKPATPAARWNPWPAAIIGYFVLAATFLAIFIVFAARQRNDVVSADYYADEIRFQQRLDQTDRANALGAQVAIAYEAARQVITIKLPPAQAQFATGHVRLYRPADASLDCELPLDLKTNGTQELAAGALKAGLWKVRIEWTAGGQDYSYERPVKVDAGRG